jgi:TPP-dependent pyruvate/acetoin dehydrogenase alpha subunit
MIAHGHTIASLQAFELEVADAFNAGAIRAPIHLSGGNEVQLLKIFESVGPDDWIFSNWRSHYHALLCGVPPDRLMADILAGRSITLNYPDHRFFSSAIVGGSLPIALGVALDIKRAGRPEFVHVFLGDMTACSGVAYECMKYAVGHDLPVHWIIEDNGLSVTTNTDAVWGKDGALFYAGENWPLTYYQHDLPWPHSGAGKRVEF